MKEIKRKTVLRTDKHLLVDSVLHRKAYVAAVSEGKTLKEFTEAALQQALGIKLASSKRRVGQDVA